MTDSSNVAGDELPRGIIPKTPFANTYESRWSQLTEADTNLLSHLNCSYFSTLGTAPTLLDLKKHAQSLTILIRKISVNTKGGEIDGKNHSQGHISNLFIENEAFDWLNDLNEPYNNDDEFHHMPLSELANKIAKETDIGGVEHQCPLTPSRIVEQTKAGKSRPYCDHQNLLRHANDCLEILDHEYSATGGLLSMLPTDDEGDQKSMEDAKQTLVGQWLLYTQGLVGRMHELEKAYANALDTLKGDSVVPLQRLSVITSGAGNAWPDRGKLGSANLTRPGNTNTEALGREIVYPQDRWVLANAGDDVFDHVHRVLDQMEAKIEPREQAWKAAGFLGENTWQKNRGGDLYDSGLVAWDVKTRYIRMRGKQRGPIFVLPAYGVHPGVSETREVEARPTVVSVTTPSWPERVSDWERKYVDKIDQATKHEADNLELKERNRVLEANSRLTEQEVASLRKSVKTYEEHYGAPHGDGSADRDITVRVLRETKEALSKEKDQYQNIIRQLMKNLSKKDEESAYAEIYGMPGFASLRLGSDRGDREMTDA